MQIVDAVDDLKTMAFSSRTLISEFWVLEVKIVRSDQNQAEFPLQEKTSVWKEQTLLKMTFTRGQQIAYMMCDQFGIFFLRSRFRF